MDNKYKICVLLFFVIFLSAFVVFDLVAYLGLPSNFHLIEGQSYQLDPKLLFWAEVNSDQREDLKINGANLEDRGLKVDLNSSFSLKAARVGSYKLDFMLFGLIPFREMRVDVLPRAKVIPGGQSVGVALKSEGIIVLGTADVELEDERRVYPARKAGIEAGDLILSVNQKMVKDKHHLARLIHYYGAKETKINLEVKKKTGEVIEKKVGPVKNKRGNYMIGLFVDDSTTGIGTISFYDPDTGYYGALGHMISTKNTEREINLASGNIYQANISGINRSQKGAPGEKLGNFFREDNFWGDISKNNQFGIFGQLNMEPKNPYFSDKIPVATPFEVEEGKAKAYTVLENREITEFAVEIKKVDRQYKPKTKGLIIEIKDQDILKKTGGIVQGMSGSPIVQNGKLVGAITHVFVNDSRLGYATFAKWMLLETEIIAEMSNTREFARKFSGIFFIKRKEFRIWY